MVIPFHNIYFQNSSVLRKTVFIILKRFMFDDCTLINLNNNMGLAFNYIKYIVYLYVICLYYKYRSGFRDLIGGWALP